MTLTVLLISQEYYVGMLSCLQTHSQSITINVKLMRSCDRFEKVMIVKSS